MAEALRQLAQEGTASVDVVLHPNPHVCRTMERLLGGCFAINLVPPCSQLRLVAQMRDCDLMLSDSGGVQEEAPELGVPLLVIRDKTERPEALWSGNMRLVDTDTGKILAAVRELLGDPVALAAMAEPSLPYGDGRASYRIASLICRPLRPDVAAAAAAARGRTAQRLARALPSSAKMDLFLQWLATL